MNRTRAWRSLPLVRLRRAVLAVAAIAVAGGVVAMEPRADAVARQAAAASSRWEARLARLDPLRPLEYLELGEEVADGAQDADERELARQLFGLAGALDTERLGRSAMLALAALATDEVTRARATAAAELVGGSGLARESMRYESAQVEALSRSFSHYRRGDGRRALVQLRQNGAEALLDAIGPRLPGGARGYRDDCVAMRASGVQLLDREMLRRQLEIELALRQGETRALSLDIALRGDEPLVEIDLADPKALWGVDPARPWWREGRWRDSL